MKKEELKKATDVALKYLGLRSRTIAEVKKKLLEKEFDSETIDKVIDQLIDWRFVDDCQYAKNYISNSQIGKPKGTYRLKRELSAKGIATEIISKEIEDYFAIESEENLALSAARKKAKTLVSCTEEKKFRRLMSYLISRGFSLDQARKACFVVLDKNSDL